MASAHPPPPPSHKLIPGCGFLVDGFRYASHAAAKAFFLSHAHAGVQRSAAPLALPHTLGLFRLLLPASCSLPAAEPGILTLPLCRCPWAPPAAADHYTGLNENWSRGPIYCSDTTARLVAHMLGVSPQFLCPLPLDTPTLIAGAPCPAALLPRARAAGCCQLLRPRAVLPSTNSLAQRTH